MAYIVVVNPAILSTPGTGMPFSGVLTATVLVCVTMTLLMGLYARLPFGVAPGMGLNAFFAYTLVLRAGVPWPVALGIVFWAGVLFLMVSATPLREHIALAIPPSLRIAPSAGIGLLLTFIGLQNAGFIAANPATIVGVGADGPSRAAGLVGLGIIVRLSRSGNPLAYLAGMFVVTAAAWVGGWVKLPAQWFSPPDFSSVFLKLDVIGALRWSLAPAIVTVMMTDLFDSLSTFIGVAHAAELTRRAGRTDSTSAKGSSSMRGRRSAPDCSAVRRGRHTSKASPASAWAAAGGATAVVTALCFLPCLFIGPMAAAVPPYATAPVLIMVGVAMFGTVEGHRLRSPGEWRCRRSRRWC